jgi:hypothetical protein
MSTERNVLIGSLAVETFVEQLKESFEMGWSCMLDGII